MKTVDELEIVVFERSSRTSYAACGLPYLVGGLVTSPDSLVARTPEQHRAKGIDVRIQHEVTAIDIKACKVIVRDLVAGLESAVQLRRTPDRHGCFGHLSTLARHRREGGCCNYGRWTTRRRSNNCWPQVRGAPWWWVPATSGWRSLKVCSSAGCTSRYSNGSMRPWVRCWTPTWPPTWQVRCGLQGSNSGWAPRSPASPWMGGRVCAVETVAGSFEADIVVIGLGVRPNAELARAAGHRRGRCRRHQGRRPPAYRQPAHLGRRRLR
jgi:hypothetical protein